MPSEQLGPHRLYQVAASRISALIHKGEYRPGERLPAERDLAKKLNISRPTVREAMIALEIAGLVEIRRNSGIYVTETPGAGRLARLRPFDAGPSPFDVIDARRLVECGVAERAAERAARADLARIDKAIADMERDMAQGGKGLEADRCFHTLIAQATGNSALVSLVDGLWEGMLSAPIFHGLSEYTGLPDHQKMTIGDHRAILAALRRKDPTAAREAMAAHLGHVLEILAGAREPSDPHLTLPSLRAGGRRGLE
jgi:DNA-binding FadR family transcriptional regulator